MGADQLTIIIPTINEADNIQPLLERIFEETSAALQLEVLFVDDGSTDETCERILVEEIVFAQRAEDEV